MEKGRIIVLNGVSSSGKTTVAEVLREKLQEPYYLISIDAFCNMVSMRYFEGGINGRVFDQITKAFVHTVRSFSDMGMHCIIDTVMLKIPGLDDFLQSLACQTVGRQALLVHVCCPLEELKRREMARGDREIGQAESQIAYLQPQDGYDLTVDTFALTTDGCVDRIIKALDCPEKMTALAQIAHKRE